MAKSRSAGSLIVTIDAKLDRLESGLQRAERGIQGFASRTESTMGKLGQSLDFTAPLMRGLAMMQGARLALQGFSVISAGVRGDFEAMNAELKRLPFGLGQAARTLEGLLMRITGLRGELDAIADRRAEMERATGRMRVVQGAEDALGKLRAGWDIEVGEAGMDARERAIANIERRRQADFDTVQAEVDKAAMENEAQIRGEIARLRLQESVVVERMRRMGGEERFVPGRGWRLEAEEIREQIAELDRQIEQSRAWRAGRVKTEQDAAHAAYLARLMDIPKTPLERMLESAAQADRELGMSADAVERMRAAMAGASDQELRWLDGVHARRAEYHAQLDREAEAKYAAAEAEREHQRVLNAGERVRWNMLTPMERYAEEVENLQGLLAGGAIDAGTFDRALSQQIETLERMMRATAGHTPSLPAAAIKDTALAYSIEVNAGRQDRFGELTAVAKEQLSVARRIEAAARELARTMSGARAPRREADLR